MTEWDAGSRDDDIVALTRPDAGKLFDVRAIRVSRVTPFRVVVAQIALSMMMARLTLDLPWHGVPHAALSVLLGGVVCWLPAALFAAWLNRRAHAGSLPGWLLGEALKVGAMVALFVAIAYGYRNVQ